MEFQRFGVTTTVFVDATDVGEAATIIERDLAGRFDSELVSVSAHLVPEMVPVVQPAARSASSTMRTSWLVAISDASVMTVFWYSTASRIHSMTTAFDLACGAATAPRNGISPQGRWPSND